MIGEKIIKIMEEIQPIIKVEVTDEDGRTYKTVKAEEIISMVQPLLIKNKVVILPQKVINFGTQGNKVHITMKYQFIDVEDQQKDCIEVEIPASGFDEKGRAVFGALTGAYRYAMQQVFAIPIKDEIQNDNKDDGLQDNPDDELDIIGNDIEESQNNGESNYLSAWMACPVWKKERVPFLRMLLSKGVLSISSGTLSNTSHPRTISPIRHS